MTLQGPTQGCNPENLAIAGRPAKLTRRALALQRVASARERVDAARFEWVAALREARGSGGTYAEIARAAGTSRQRVRQLLQRAK